jgi:hypothetical protein
MVIAWGLASTGEIVGGADNEGGQRSNKTSQATVIWGIVFSVGAFRNFIWGKVVGSVKFLG